MCKCYYSGWNYIICAAPAQRIHVGLYPKWVAPSASGSQEVLFDFLPEHFCSAVQVKVSSSNLSVFVIFLKWQAGEERKIKL